MSEEKKQPRVVVLELPFEPQTKLESEPEQIVVEARCRNCGEIHTTGRDCARCGAELFEF